MGPLDILEIRLKGDVIPRKRTCCEIHVGFRERRVDHQQRVHGRRTGGGDPREEGLKGEIPADVVRDWVCEHDIFEPTRGNLEVVLWIAPRPNAVKGGVGKYRRVIEVRGILCPVPTGLYSRVSTFRPQRVFKSLDIDPVPGKKETRSVD